MSQSDQEPEFTSTCFDKYKAATEIDFLSSYRWDFSCRLPIITSRTVHCAVTRVQPLPPLQSFYPDRSWQLMYLTLRWKGITENITDFQINKSTLSCLRLSTRRTTEALITESLHQYERDVCFSIRRPRCGSRLIFPDECFIKEGRASADGDLTARLLGSSAPCWDGNGTREALIAPPNRLQCSSYQTIQGFWMKQRKHTNDL